MDMAKFKLRQMADHGDLLEKYGAKLRIIGEKHRLRKDVVEAIEEAVEMTKNNGDRILNICFPYTSRPEITSAIRETVREYSEPLRPGPKRPFSETRISRSIHSKQISDLIEEEQHSHSSAESSNSDGDDTAASVASSSDPSPSSQTSAASSPSPLPTKHIVHYPDPESITAETLDKHMWFADSPPLDLLIRTSGVQRLSDFMLWQCHQKTEVIFLNCLWPEFDLWHFLPVMVQWQWKQRQKEELQAPNKAVEKRKRRLDLARRKHGEK